MAPLHHGQELQVEPTLTAVAGARALIRHVLRSGGADSAERAAVCGSELVTNAVRHGQPPILLSVLAGPGHVVVAVEDASRQPPLPRVAGAADTGGRGTLVVDRLADRWGVEFLPTGKRVWCLVADHEVLTSN
jgi:anti-sigma regulatory factor (Ser/Thr protein kinase)